MLSSLFFSSAKAQKAEMYLVTDNPITFDNSKYYLGWSSHPTKGYYLQEYFVEGESAENFSRMLTINLIETTATPEEAASLKLEELDKRKKTDKICNYMIFRKGNEIVIDFLVSDANGNDNLTLVERDIHYYKTVRIGQKSYIQLSFFTLRATGDNIIPFIKSIPDSRTAMITALTEADLSVEKVKE